MPATAPPRLFCFGLGYVGRALAASLRTEGWRVAGTGREGDCKDAIPFDGTAPMRDAAAALAGTTHLLSTIPPGADDDPVLAHHRDDIAAIAGLRWIGYLSTTGVYGDRGGDWVDEDAPRRPSGARGQRRVTAEDAWLALDGAAGPAHVFRLAGIYGPGRGPLAAVRAGRARRIVKPGQVFGRVHVDDIVQVLKASMARPAPGTAYNVCDDEPAPPQDVIAHACALLDVAPPPEIPFDEAGLSDMAQSFYRDNRRVSNRRIKEALGVSLRWPTYREGLKGLLRCGDSPP